ncbi:MAG: OmpA family protein [Pseudooceanicola sp.]|nr:OmpA family protein [Pseudooceanicola sp.]
MIRRACLALALVLVPGLAAAVELALPPGARALAERISPADSYDLPTGPFTDGAVPKRTFEGRVERLTWRLDTPGLTTLQALGPLRAQVEQAGFHILFQCESRDCGGFDFRFNTEVVPAPDMFVDIRSYRFLAATRGAAEAISLLVSRSRSAAYVQIVYVNRTNDELPPVGAETRPVTADPALPGLVDTLVQQGHAVLSDLVFETGSDALDPGPYPSLQQLAEFLAGNPTMVVALVGHTDSIGGLEQNIALSKRRAESVRARLTGGLGAAKDRVQAEGMGYLAPVASNLTPEGREANRRVEVILLSQ